MNITWVLLYVWSKIYLLPKVLVTQIIQPQKEDKSIVPHVAFTRLDSLCLRGRRLTLLFIIYYAWQLGS